MSSSILLWPILLPVLFAVISIILPSRIKVVREVLMIFGSGAILVLAGSLTKLGEFNLILPWTSFGLDFDLRYYHFSGFILLWTGIFGFLITLYSAVKMYGHPRIREYYAYLFLNLAFVSGAVLANNLILLVFFWEGLLLTLYGLISLGGKESYRTALKGLLIVGFCDFCLILGIALLWLQTGTFRMSSINVVPNGIMLFSFILMMIGAIGKAGALPFHTWIPDAAIDAPVTVMAFLPGSIEKLVGIYLLARLTLDLFAVTPGGAVAITLMTIGAITIVVAVMMALVQKDLKRLLSYHAISQVGYMVLGLGTAVPIGIAGGLFHMLNNAIYKCGLFLGAGAVEHQTGTTEMKKLGGLGRVMPVTAVCFGICAAAISGIWPLNGFVSKEMIFHGSYETGYVIFTIAAWIGAVFTFASFFKATHSVFLGKPSMEVSRIKGSKLVILVPMIVLAGLSILFGVYNKLPLMMFFKPVLDGHVLPGTDLEFLNHGLDFFNPIALVSLVCLAIGFAIHYYGWIKGGKNAYMASEPVHHLPVLNKFYDWAEAKLLDPYEQGVKSLRDVALIFYYGVDRVADFCFDGLWVMLGRPVASFLRMLHNGRYSNYLAWTVAGAIAVTGLIGLIIRGIK